MADEADGAEVQGRMIAPSCGRCTSLEQELAKALRDLEWARLETSQADAELERIRDRYERKVA